MVSCRVLSEHYDQQSHNKHKDSPQLFLERQNISDCGSNIAAVVCEIFRCESPIYKVRLSADVCIRPWVQATEALRQHWRNSLG